MAYKAAKSDFCIVKFSFMPPLPAIHEERHCVFRYPVWPSMYVLNAVVLYILYFSLSVFLFLAVHETNKRMY